MKGAPEARSVIVPASTKPQDAITGIILNPINAKTGPCRFYAAENFIKLYKSQEVF